MPLIDRRRFLGLVGGASAAAGFTTSIANAASIPANRASGSIEDVEHIVMLMQENRSFDQYFGSLRGVRGFGDPHPATLPNGRSVWHQPNGGGEVLPFHPTVDDLGGAFLEGLAHAWPDGQDAVRLGNYDNWVPAKTPITMSYLTRQDAAFHYALADAFTVCDGYHCSFIGSTDPNRYYMWTGWVGNDGRGGGPVLFNDETGYDWTTYPERLEAAGISWKVYQDIGIGLDAAGGWGWGDDAFIGNYGDNSLLYFNTYRNAAPGSPLFEKARTGTNNKAGQDYFDILTADVKADRLPQISYIAAPEAFSEHPNWPVKFGAWYISKVLDALTSNPDVWSRTALFITYDENDGFFDHVVPPLTNSDVIPGASTVPTTNELYAGSARAKRGPYGLGPRVPMLVVSPWSTGGWVCSETFDHTSIIRFMERRFGVQEPQLTPWRRAVAGDLTSAFDFSKNAAAPPLPSTADYVPPDRDRHDSYVPAVPAQGALPVQEPGTRPARPLDYQLDVVELPNPTGITVDLVNSGKLGVHVQARLIAPAGAPHSYTVGAGAHLLASWPVAGDYDIHLHGPNGFFRRLAGSARLGLPTVGLLRDGRSANLRITVIGALATRILVQDAYAGEVRLNPLGSATVDTNRNGGWYDLTVSAPGTPWVRAFAGHLETGRPSTSDPAFGRPASA